MTETATIQPAFRADVQALLDKHLADLPDRKLIDDEIWPRYRAFRSELHNIVGCGAEAEQRDNGMFIKAVGLFCERIGLA